VTEKLRIDIEHFDPAGLDLLAWRRSERLPQLVQVHRLGLPLDADLNVSSEYLAGGVVKEHEGLLLHQGTFLVQGHHDRFTVRLKVRDMEHPQPAVYESPKPDSYAWHDVAPEAVRTPVVAAEDPAWLLNPINPKNIGDDSIVPIKAGQ